MFYIGLKKLLMGKCYMSGLKLEKKGVNWPMGRLLTRRNLIIAIFLVIVVVIFITVGCTLGLKGDGGTRRSSGVPCQTITETPDS
ncbi:hypothetical protein ACFL56_00385 [Candidatus Margulisiibacteriota bacterium]